MQQVFDFLKGKDWGNPLLLVTCTCWLTLWSAKQVRAVEQQLDARFNQIQNQIDKAWTIEMMAVRDSMVAARNPTNWIPDSYRIYEAVRAGKMPDPTRIMP